MPLEGRSLRSTFSHFIASTIASLMVFSLYSMVDGLFVARGVGEYAMSAVNLAVPFINAIFSVAVLFAVGTSTIIAIYLGQGQREPANRLFSQDIVLLLIIGGCITALVFAFMEPFCLLLGATEETFLYVKDYLIGLAPFAVCFIVSYNLEILIKTDGRPRLAMITVCIGCVANCVMDYLAIFEFDMGIKGAAIATGLSQLLTCIIYLTHFFGKKSTFRFTRFKPDFQTYKRLIPIGIPDGITELCNGLMIFLFNRTIIRCIGADGVVIYTIIAYATTLIINIMVGVSQGSQPLVSYYLGKGEVKTCRQLLRYGLVTVSAVTAVCFTLFMVFAPQLVTAFLGHEHEALNAAATAAFRQYSLCYLLIGFNVLFGGFLTAVEQPKPAIAISLGRGFVLQSFALLLLAATFGGNSIWSAPLISEALCLVLSVWLLKRYLNKQTS
jgi:putative MATE family efflux protein